MTRIRKMTEADLETVAELRVSGWRTAYPGLVPRRHLDAMDAAADAARHRERLASGDDPAADEVAEAAGEVVGWVCYGPCRDGDQPAASGELYALYVRPDLIRTGVGRALWRAALEGARQRGYARMVVWVLKGNARARRFYERAGCAADGAQRTDDIDGTPVPEVRYVLDPLPAP
ncbi:MULTISPECIES: GNAT family N-acetyltransferase [Streptomyces]|uniref:N-acetyltransferase n=1 Tax=Streptomyces griseocarneus TaxID=51201 RepID=A0ABX7RU57_9ACTN|nr:MULTISPECIES: GNAT family N-acetyltransferase [Streptomyces]QSY50426.1 N-acetyltransferase [Streptomyces griseocarneus]